MIDVGTYRGRLIREDDC